MKESLPFAKILTGRLGSIRILTASQLLSKNNSVPRLMWIVYWNKFHQRGFCCYILVVIDYDQITILDLEDLGTVRRKVTELCINSSIKDKT